MTSVEPVSANSALPSMFTPSRSERPIGSAMKASPGRNSVSSKASAVTPCADDRSPAPPARAAMSASSRSRSCLKVAAQELVEGCLDLLDSR